MTLNIAQLIERYNGLIDELEAAWPNIVAKAAQDALALIEERITTTGTGPNGAALKPYTKPYKKLKENPGKYKRGKDLGLASTRFTGVTDYTLTGLFWKDIKVLQIESVDNNVLATIGAETSGNVKIMESLTKRDGFPLRMSEMEKEIVSENTNNEVITIIRKYFPN